MKLNHTTTTILSDLLEDLEETFPDTIPINSNPSLEDFRKLQGHQEVIQFIRNLLDDGEEE